MAALWVLQWLGTQSFFLVKADTRSRLTLLASARTAKAYLHDRDKVITFLRPSP
jgi:hypothetical protein